MATNKHIKDLVDSIGFKHLTEGELGLLKSVSFMTGKAERAILDETGVGATCSTGNDGVLTAEGMKLLQRAAIECARNRIEPIKVVVSNIIPNYYLQKRVHKKKRINKKWRKKYGMKPSPHKAAYFIDMPPGMFGMAPGRKYLIIDSAMEKALKEGGFTP